MAKAGIEHWTEKAKQSAVDQLVALVNENSRQHASSLQPKRPSFRSNCRLTG